jgi:protein required for attachment to host cells
MPKERNLLIVIADGARVRFVRSGEANTLHSDPIVESPDVHRQSSDLGSDHPGASLHSDSTAHHALAPRHDLHALAKEKFAHAVAQELNAGSAGGAFDKLVLIAPAHILADIRGALDTTTSAKIIGTLPKDLVKTPDHELWPHVRAWVPPVRRVAI